MLEKTSKDHWFQPLTQHCKATTKSCSQMPHPCVCHIPPLKGLQHCLGQPVPGLNSPFHEEISKISVGTLRTRDVMAAGNKQAFLEVCALYFMSQGQLSSPGISLGQCIHRHVDVWLCKPSVLLLEFFYNLWSSVEQCFQIFCGHQGKTCSDTSYAKAAVEVLLRSRHFSYELYWFSEVHTKFLVFLSWQINMKWEHCSCTQNFSICWYPGETWQAWA